MSDRRAAWRRLFSTPSARAAEAIASEAKALRRLALACEAEGRVRDAIEVWSELARLRPDVTVEERLVDLRCAPNDPPPPEAGVDPWPRELEDPFPETSARPPEIAADELSMELLGGAILHHGCLLVRGLFTSDRVDALRATIDRAFLGRADHLRAVPSTETTPWYVPCAQWDTFAPSMANDSRLFNDAARAVHAADSPRALEQVVEALNAAGVVQVISEYLGEPALLSVQKTMLRRVPPEATPSWHQDGAFMGSSTRAVDVWVALSDCGDGTDAPGLAILPKRLNASVRGETFDIVLSEDEFAAAGDGVAPLRPKFGAGDALLFDELLLHANGGGQSVLTKPRYALEAWMVAPSSMPARYLPIRV